MKSLQTKLRRSASLVRLSLVIAATALTFQASASAQGGFGGNGCVEFCQSLCDSQRYQCYDICDWNHPTDPAARDACYWDCSLQGGACVENCTERC